MEFELFFEGKILRVRLEWTVSELCKIEEHKTCWGRVSQNVPFLMSPCSPHRSYHLSLASPSQLFFPINILTHSSFPFNENDSNNKWKPNFFYFISSSSQQGFTEESPGLISSMSSLRINFSASFSLVVVSVLY